VKRITEILEKVWKLSILQYRALRLQQNSPPSFYSFETFVVDWDAKI